MQVKFSILCLAASLLLPTAAFGLDACASKPALTVSFIDVGLGDATLIRCEQSGFDVLIDGGDSDKNYPGAHTNLRAELKKRMRDDSTLDFVISTHPHPDHLIGLRQLVLDKELEIGHYVDAGLNVADSSLEETTRQKLKQQKIRYTNHYRKHLPSISVCRLPKSKEIATLELFSPSIKHWRSLNCRTDVNTCSIISKLTTRTTSFLLMADAGKTREAVLLDSPGKNNLPSTVLRVGHHGSAFSTTAELLAAVNPLYAIISVGKPNVGKTNELGYPDTETLGRISKYFRKRFPEEISGPSIKSCSKTKQSCVWEDTALHPRVLATPTEGTITLGLSEDGSLCRA